MGSQRTGGFAITRDDVEKPFGETRSQKQFGQFESRARAGWGRLGNEGIACCQSGRKFLHQQSDRRIEGSDAADHTVRHMPRHADMARSRCGRIDRQNLSVDLGQGSRASFDEFNAAFHLETGDADRLADVFADDLGDLLWLSDL